MLEQPDLVDVWRRLGLRTLGRVAELAVADVLARFGTPGVIAHRLASGLDPRPLDARRPAPELAVSQELDPPADRVDRAAFVAKALADQLHARLAADGLACTHVLVEAETEHGETLARHWRHEGALTAGALADRVRWQLDGWLTGSATLRPTAGIAHLTLVPVEVVAARGRQLGFWGGETLVDERVLRAVARVQGTAGMDAVAVPELRGGRGPAERVVRVSAAIVDLTSPRPAARPASVAEPWPGQIPAPGPGHGPGGPRAGRGARRRRSSGGGHRSGRGHRRRPLAWSVPVGLPHPSPAGRARGRPTSTGGTPPATGAGPGSRCSTPAVPPTCSRSRRDAGGSRPPTTDEMSRSERCGSPRTVGEFVRFRVGLAHPARGSSAMTRKKLFGTALAMGVVGLVLAACKPTFPAGSALTTAPSYGPLVRITWPTIDVDADKTVTEYRIDVNGTEIARLNAAARSCTLVGLAKGAEATISVTAYDSAGQWSGDPSNPTGTVSATYTPPTTGPGSGTTKLCVPTSDVDGDRLPDSVETNTGTYLHAGSTGSSPSTADTDADGIKDGDEVLGTTAGLDLPAMGASPTKKTLALEFDWFDDNAEPGTCASHSHRPTAGMVAKVVTAYGTAPVSNPDGTTGISVIADYGQGGAFTGGNLIADADGVIAGGVGGTDYTRTRTPTSPPTAPASSTTCSCPTATTPPRPARARPRSTATT